MHINRHDTAVIFIDPRSEGSSANDRAYGAGDGDGHASKTVENMERIRKAAKRSGLKVFVSPHYFYASDDGWRFNGPREAEEHESGVFNDIVLQLRRHGIRQVIVGGVVANMCVESHLRDLLEQGFAVVIARDATSGPRPADPGDGYTAALIDFAFLAHAVLSTDDLVDAMG